MGCTLSGTEVVERKRAFALPVQEAERVAQHSAVAAVVQVLAAAVADIDAALAEIGCAGTAGNTGDRSAG